MTTTTSIAPIDLGVTILDQARSFTLGLAEAIPDDKLLHRPVPQGNHAMYILGHLAWAEDSFRASLGGLEPLAPELTKERFGYGITLSDDPGDYPDRSLVLDRLTATRAALLEWFRGMDDAQLATELPEEWRSFAPTFGALMPACAWHEAIHCGQLTIIRKSLGIPPLFG